MAGRVLRHPPRFYFARRDGDEVLRVEEGSLPRRQAGFDCAAARPAGAGRETTCGHFAPFVPQGKQDDGCVMGGESAPRSAAGHPPQIIGGLCPYKHIR